MGKNLFVATFLVVFLFCGSSLLLAKEKRPNILLIVVDDMGYS